MKKGKETDKTEIERIEAIAEVEQRIEKKDQEQDKERIGALAEEDQEEVIIIAMEGKRM